jgi:hypothetical protein
VIKETIMAGAGNEKTEKIEKTKPDIAAPPPVKFDESTMRELAELLEWWRARKEAGIDKVTQEIAVRPNFKRGGKSDSVTRSIRIGKDLAEAAEKRAKKEKALTGGSFSGLVEYLLWDFLGRDPKFLETE